MDIVSITTAKSIGLKRYFTGIPCVRGHTAERMVSSRACCECVKIKLAQYRIDNRASLLQRKRDYAKQQRADRSGHLYAIAKKSVAKHRVKRNQEKLAWRKKNAPRILAWCRARHVAKVQRTPSWLTPDDHWMIEQAYELAAKRTKLFGFAWHVDHIIPLLGKNVSGLHVPKNLQVIPGVENLRKGNRHG